MEGTHVFTSSGQRIGVIGIELENTPELVKAGNTAGLRFLPELQTIRTESERLRRDGIRIQVVLIHDGTSVGSNRVNDDAAVAWEGPIVEIAKGSRTPPWTSSAPATPIASRTRWSATS